MEKRPVDGRGRRVNVAKFILVCAITILPVEGQAHETDRPLLASATTRLAACPVTPSCTGRQTDLSKAETLIDPQNQRASGQATGQQRRSWAGRHPVLTGALMGASIGAMLGATGGTEPGTSRAADIVFTTSIGAGIGALIGRAFR